MRLLLPLSALAIAMVGCSPPPEGDPAAAPSAPTVNTAPTGSNQAKDMATKQTPPPTATTPGGPGLDATAPGPQRGTEVPLGGPVTSPPTPPSEPSTKNPTTSPPGTAGPGTSGTR